TGQGAGDPGTLSAQMHPEIDRILIDGPRIAARVREMGAQIAADLEAECRNAAAGDGGGVVLVPILTGAIVFVADLIRHMPLKMRLGVVAVSSYPGRSMQSKGAAIRGEIPPDLRGKHVLIVDDILDSGRTLGLVRRLILEQRPASLRIAVLLRKILAGGAARAEEVPVDYVGFAIP